MTYHTPEDEMVHRLRRIETRLTRFLLDQGVEAGSRQPVRHGRTIKAPGYFTTLADLLDLIPADDRADGATYDVMVGDHLVARLFVEVPDAD